VNHLLDDRNDYEVDEKDSVIVPSESVSSQNNAVIVQSDSPIPHHNVVFARTASLSTQADSIQTREVGLNDRSKRVLHGLDFGLVVLAFLWILPVCVQYWITRPQPNWRPVLTEITYSGNPRHGGRSRTAFQTVHYKYTVGDKPYSNEMTSIPMFLSWGGSELKGTRPLAYYSIDNPKDAVIPSVGEKWTQDCFVSYFLCVFLVGTIALTMKGMGAMSNENWT
jgi:Protein of unknown function (DUF3592)